MLAEGLFTTSEVDIPSDSTSYQKIVNHYIVIKRMIQQHLY